METKQTNNIVLGRERLVVGANAIADVVKLTLGAAGGNAILPADLSPFHVITNDGISIVNEAHFEDPMEEMGANILREVAKRANDQSGDGTTTSIVLAQAIINGAKDFSGIEIKKSLDECLPTIIESIDKQTIELNEEDVKSVATISAEDEIMGQTIADIYKEIGKDGLIELDNSRTFETYYELKDGLSFPQACMVSPEFSNKDNKAEYEKPVIFVTDQTLSIEADIFPVADMVRQAGKNNLVIVCDRIDTGALTFLVNNKKAGLFNFLVIQAPTVMKDYFYEDFTLATGATLVGPKSGKTLKTATMQDMGTCDRLICTKDETRIIGVQDLSKHVESLQGQHQTAILQERIRRLNTKVAVLYLSANSESELKYKNLKAEDAVNATKLALKYGVVAGGGVALLNASQSLPDTLGGNLLRHALKAPIRQIMENAGAEYNEQDPVIKLGGTKGFNAKTGEVADMLEAKIIDPASVVKNSVRSAISVASTLLSIKAGIYKQKQPEAAPNPFQMIG